MNNEIENGTVDPSAMIYSTKYSISTSNVYDSVPGAVSFNSFDSGADILYIDLTNVSITIDGDFTSRKSLSNQSRVILKKGNLTKILPFIKIYPSAVNSNSATKIIFDSSVIATDLFDFIGLSGAPSASGKAYLNLKATNDFDENDLSTNLTISKTKMDSVQGVDTGESSVTFSWSNDNDVSSNTGRWRAVPRLRRLTDVSYTTVKGAYSALPFASVNSSWGSGETIELVGSIVSVSVVKGGTFSGIPTITATYPGATGAVLSVGMTGNSIGSVSVISGGLGYNATPTLIISGATVISAPILTCLVGIESVNVLTKGYDYVSPPTVALQGDSGSGGSVTAFALVTNEGTVDYVKVNDGGAGYVNGQQVSFTGGSGSNASGTIVVDSTSAIVSVIMNDFGYGYISAPDVSVIGQGSGADLSAVVSLYSDWNYDAVDASSHSYTVDNFKNYLGYEWQLYSKSDKRVTNFSVPLKFKFS